VVVGQARVFYAPDDAGIEVIAKIFAHRRQSVPHFDAEFLQDLGIADAGEFQQLRRRHCPRAQDDLAAGPRLNGLAVPGIADADAAPAVESQAS
jgi:hypothetical protein